jgi:hypothetical protein
MNNIEKNIYIHHNYNRNELRQILLENSNYQIRPATTVGNDIGLVYYDTLLKHIMVWNGTVWKISQYLDDRDYSIPTTLLVENIWSDSQNIPTLESTANGSTIVDKVVDVITTYVPNSYSFESSSIYDIIPVQYAAFYEPVVKTYNDVIIPVGTNNYKIENNIITFYDGFINASGLLVDETHPPKITYWRYTGGKGGISLNTSNVFYSPLISEVVYTQFVSYTIPSSINNGSILNVFVNGLSTYNWTYNYTTNVITFDQTALGYFFDIDDTIAINVRV